MNSKKTYGRYQIVEKIGSGAMGVVYKAYDPRMKRFVALKVLRTDRVVSHEYIARFYAEAHAISQLSHPNIVIVFDQGEDHGTLFIIMELLNGRSLQDVINKQRIEHQTAIGIGVEVAKALDYAHKHEKRIIHRDIKPSNIIVLPDGKIKITDFGIAKIEDPEATRKTQDGQLLGTPGYMSPEQFTSDPLDGRTDLFSLGVVVYEMVTGQKPFKANNLAALAKAISNDTPVAPDQLDPSVEPRLSQLIMKSLAKKPDERFQTGAEMALELKKCLHRRKSDAAQPAEPPKKGHKSMLFAIVAVLIMVIFASGMLYYEINQTSETNRVMVTIDSLPSDAQIFIDGILKGETPMHIGLNKDKHAVRLSKDGYYPLDVQLNLDEDVELQLNEDGELPLYGELMPIQSGITDKGD